MMLYANTKTTVRICLTNVFCLSAWLCNRYTGLDNSNKCIVGGFITSTFCRFIFKRKLWVSHVGQQLLFAHSFAWVYPIKVRIASTLDYVYKCCPMRFEVLPLFCTGHSCFTIVQVVSYAIL